MIELSPEHMYRLLQGDELTVGGQALVPDGEYQEFLEDNTEVMLLLGQAVRALYRRPATAPPGTIRLPSGAEIADDIGAVFGDDLDSVSFDRLPGSVTLGKFKLSKRSLKRLEGVHKDLILVVKRAIQITEIDFCVLEGLRSESRQQELVKTGASQTMNSRHLTGHAVDLGAYVGGTVAWDWPLYDKISEAMKTAADDVGVPVEWGGDWESLKDGPHYQLPWDKYPADKST